MKTITRLLAILLLVSAATALANPGVEIKDAWVRQAPPNAQVMAAYMTLLNHGPHGKTVVGAASPLFAKVEFHETIHKNGMAMMQRRESLPIESGGKMVLKPSGYHMMLIAPQTQNLLKAGDQVPLVLHFSDGTRYNFTSTVQKNMGAPMGHQNHHQNHHAH